MSGQAADKGAAARLADELNLCRQRGLADLDLGTHNQTPVAAPELERLARSYDAATGHSLHGRVAQTTRLIEDTLVIYEREVDQAGAQLITALFFDPLVSMAKQGPGPVLDKVQAASGLTEDDFRKHRRRVFLRYASFLRAYVTDMPGGLPSPTAAALSRRRSRARLAAAVAVGIFIASGIALALVGQHRGSSPASHTPTAARYIGLPPGSRTYTEQAGEYGSITVPDPDHPFAYDQAAKVAAYQQVQVSCKVYADTVPNIRPDGYWYRLAGQLWDNKYYAIANNFMNGDAIGGPYTHNTDFAVPDCPT